MKLATWNVNSLNVRLLRVDPAAFVGATHVTPPERERFAALLAELA